MYLFWAVDSCWNTSEWSVIPDELDECYEDSSFDYKNKKLFQYNSLDKENISSNIDNQTISLIKNLNAASKDEYYKERPFATYSRTSTFSEIDKDFGLVNVHRPEIGTARLPLIPLNKTSIENYSNAVHQEAWNESQNIQLSNGSFDHEVVTLKVDINQTTFSNEVFLTNTLDGSVKRLLLNKPILQYVFNIKYVTFLPHFTTWL